MKIKIKYIPLLSLAVMAAFSSCISDDSLEGGKPLPTLAVQGSDAETMPVYNFYMGEDAVLKPEVTYTGSDSLTYHWQVGTYANGTKGELKDAGYGPELRYHFYEGGSHYAHLTVTDGKVGVAADYQINMNRTFEEGYLITATDADGGGNLTFVKALTPEETAAGTGDVIVEHALERINEGVSEKTLVGVQTGSYWNRDTYKDILRLIISTQDSCYFVEPNELTVISASTYNDINPGFKASAFYKAMSGMAPYVYDKAKKKFEHIQVKNQFPFDYNLYAGFQPEDIMQGKSNYWGSDYVTDYYLDYTNSLVYLFNAYFSYGMGEAWFVNTKDLLKGQTLLTAFPSFEPNASYAIPSYIMSRTSSTVTLWTCNVSAYQMTDGSFTPVTIDAASDLAVPAQATLMVPSLKYHRMFYPIGNRVYVFLPDNAFALPKLSEYAIAFPENEEVTYMTTNSGTEELYVGTYNSSTRRGSFYIYNCADVSTGNASSVQPKKVYKDCTGRIKDIMYKQSIQ